MILGSRFSLAEGVPRRKEEGYAQTVQPCRNRIGRAAVSEIDVEYPRINQISWLVECGKRLRRSGPRSFHIRPSFPKAVLHLRGNDVLVFKDEDATSRQQRQFI